MKNLTTHKNWLREEVTPPLLRRTGTRVNKLQRDWDRDFSFQTLDRDALGCYCDSICSQGRFRGG